MESVRELQRQGKPVNIALGECKDGDEVVLHHDDGEMGNFKVGDILQVRIKGINFSTLVEDGLDQVLANTSRVYKLNRKEILVKVGICDVGDEVQIVSNHTHFHRFEIGDIVTVVETETEYNNPSCEKDKLNQYIERDDLVRLIKKAE